MGYGYIIGICVVLFVMLSGGFGVLLWMIINRGEVKRSLLTHPNDRKPRGAGREPDEDDLQSDAER